MEKQKLSPEELILKAQTACGDAHTIESKVLDTKGHLLKYVGTVDLKTERIFHDHCLEDGKNSAEWDANGKLLKIAGCPTSDQIRDHYRLVIIEKIAQS